MTDYPDWQAFPNAQSDNLFPGFTQNLAPGLHTGTILPALSWSSLIVIASPTAGAAKVSITHFADAAGTQSIDSDTWPVNATTRLVVRTPLRGKYVRIDYNVTSAVNLAIQNWANFLSATSDRISFPVGNQNLSDFNRTLAANGSVTYTTGEIVGGQAFAYVKPYDTTGKLAFAMYVVDELGNPGQLICDFGQPTAITRQPLSVPDGIIQFEVDNKDAAAAHTFDFSLTIPPQ